MSYHTILCDPPWSYQQRLGRGLKAGQIARGGLPYQSMSIEDITSLPVGDLAAHDCQLWLWTTNAHLHSAFHVLESWGFQYKTCLTWAKNQIGLGYWLRGASEHCLLAVRGNPRSKLKGPHGGTGMSYSTVITAPRQKHSQKPEAAYTLIEAMSENPRLEIFARVQRSGWDCVGSEIDGVDVSEALAQLLVHS